MVIDPATGKRHTVIEGATFARYGDGRLVLVRGATAFTVPFDLSRLAVTGAAVPVAEKIAIDPSEGMALVVLAAERWPSSTGTLCGCP